MATFKLTHYPVSSLLQRHDLELVRGAGAFVDLGGSLEGLVIAMDGQEPRGEHAECVWDVEHAQHVEEDRPVAMRAGRIVQLHRGEVRLQECGISGDYPG